MAPPKTPPLAPPQIHTLQVSLRGHVVTMPAQLVAGTYYVHVSTSDASNALQVVRPAASTTPTSFMALYTAFRSSSSGPAVETAFRRWRTSVTFVGGAYVVPRALSGTMQTAGGQGTFAITLTAGKYWFYTSLQGQIQGTASEVREITVVGPAQQVAIAAVATARFEPVNAQSVSLPRTIPTHGFLLGIGGNGMVNTLSLQRLRPGVTDAQLQDATSCITDLPPPRLQCFQEPSQLHLGGGISGGQTALWYYSLPPGDYAVFQGSTNAAGDNPSLFGLVTRVTVT